MLNLRLSLLGLSHYQIHFRVRRGNVGEQAFGAERGEVLAGCVVGGSGVHTIEGYGDG